MKSSDITVTAVAFLAMPVLITAIEWRGGNSCVSICAEILVNAILLAYPVFAGIRARSLTVAVCLGFLLGFLTVLLSELHRSSPEAGVVALAAGGVCSGIALVASLITLAVRRRRARRLGKSGPAVVLRHEMMKLALIAPMFVFGFMAYWGFAWFCADHHISMTPIRGLLDLMDTLGEPAFCILAIVGSIAFPLYTVLYFTVRRLSAKTTGGA